MELKPTDVQAAIDAGTELAKPSMLVENHLLGVSLPAGARYEQIDIEKYHDKPTRKRGVFTYDDRASFVEAINADKNSRTHIFAREKDGSTGGSWLVALFNGNVDNNHTDGDGVIAPAPEPGWGDHRAMYPCPYSEEWKVWTGQDGKRKNQVDFAEFLENNLPDIVEPSGSALLSACENLSEKRDVSFQSKVNRTNGNVEFTFNETSNAGATTAGAMTVPESFVLGIPVYMNGESWKVTARLRHRIDGGKLAMWYDLERPERVLHAAFLDVVEKVRADTSSVVLLGAPPPIKS